jgi:anti-sigma-K factor RskA
VDIQAYIQSGVIESYVLGLANAQEIAELETLSKQFPEVKKAIAQFEAALEKTALQTAIEPPTVVKENLFAALSTEFNQPEQKKQALVINIGWVKYVIAASVILLIVSSALNVYFYQQVLNVNEKYTKLFSETQLLQANINSYKTIYSNMQLMSDPAMAKISLPGVKGKENNLATVFWDTRSKDVYVLTNKMPETPQGKQYQLWALVNGKPVDAGVLDNCNGLCKLKNITQAQQFAITLENKGGSPTPHLDQLYVIGSVKA